VGRSRTDFDDCANAVLDRLKRRIETDGHVPAADVEANAGNADLLLVGNDATDRLCVTEVAIGAHDAGVHELDREMYTQELLAARVKHAPDSDFDRERPSWSSTIQAIYVVRCNLFHGEKGDTADDTTIAQGAFNTLLGFIDGVDLYQWHGS
jgi:hypothetical protein